MQQSCLCKFRSHELQTAPLAIKITATEKIEQVLSDDQRPAFEENGVATFIPQNGTIHGICKVPNDTFQHICISKHKILVRGL